MSLPFNRRTCQLIQQLTAYGKHQAQGVNLRNSDFRVV